MRAGDPDRNTLMLELLFCCFLLALLLVFFVAAFQYPAVTRRAPLVVMLPLSLMVIGQTFATYGRLKRAPAGKGEPTVLPRIEQKAVKKGFQVFFALMALLLLIYLFGHIGGCALFLLLFLKGISGESWKIAIGVAIAVPGCMYVLFERILMIVLYKGVIFESVMERIWS